tara:strand:+ start:3335 stop:3718 length:384 start_codon:yes stop_codon:yes gene_type:complete
MYNNILKKILFDNHGASKVWSAMLVVCPDFMMAIKKAIRGESHRTDAMLPDIGAIKLIEGCTLSDSDMITLKKYIFIENFHDKNGYHSVLFQGSALTEKQLHNQIEEFERQRNFSVKLYDNCFCTVS